MLMRFDPFRELERLTQQTGSRPTVGRAHGRLPPG